MIVMKKMIVVVKNNIMTQEIIYLVNYKRLTKIPVKKEKVIMNKIKKNKIKGVKRRKTDIYNF